MSKRLPKIYQGENKITSNNKKTYYSFSNDSKQEESNNKQFDTDNFFKYFNKKVEIELMDNTVINSKILSKIDNRLLLENGNYLELNKIKNIK